MTKFDLLSLNIPLSKSTEISKKVPNFPNLINDDYVIFFGPFVGVGWSNGYSFQLVTKFYLLLKLNRLKFYLLYPFGVQSIT